MCESIPVASIFLPPGHLKRLFKCPALRTIFVGKCPVPGQQKLPTKITRRAGNLNSFFKCPGFARGGMLAVGIDSHISVYSTVISSTIPDSLSFLICTTMSDLAGLSLLDFSSTGRISVLR